MDRSNTRPAKKIKRLRGSCDACKRTKSDSAERPGGKCTSCIQAHIECTHLEVTKSLGAAQAYVEQLEAHVTKLEHIIQQYLPGIDIDNPHLGMTSSPSPATLLDADLPRNDDLEVVEVLATRFGSAAIGEPNDQPFLGRSSPHHLLQTALSAKRHYTGVTPALAQQIKRPLFWDTLPWESPTPRRLPKYVLPPEDLIPALAANYFDHVNSILPLLHRPTFDRQFRSGQHFSDHLFAATLLLVCAIGSRYSNDPRVLADQNYSISAGYMWAKQVTFEMSSPDATRVEHLQHYALSAIYQPMVGQFKLTWIRSAHALHVAVDMGLNHYKKSPTPNAQYELWKRAFWVLRQLDLKCSSIHGRPLTIADEDIEVEYPIDCDDEYWDHPDPALNFLQPAGKPSAITHFIQALDLSAIFSHAIVGVYRTKKSRWTAKTHIQDTVTQLDSALNEWLDVMPAHLKWDPNAPDSLFKRQSMHLYAAYYHIQMFVHRPFIPTPHASRSSSLSEFSLTICTNAARRCIALGKNLLVQPMWAYLDDIHLALFQSTAILILANWSIFSPSATFREEGNIQVCLDAFKRYESGSVAIGRIRDFISELSSASSRGPSTSYRKRPREEDGVDNPQQNSSGSFFTVPTLAGANPHQGVLPDASSSAEWGGNQPPITWPTYDQVPLDVTAQYALFDHLWMADATAFQSQDWTALLEGLTQGWPELAPPPFWGKVQSLRQGMNPLS